MKTILHLLMFCVLMVSIGCSDTTAPPSPSLEHLAEKEAKVTGAAVSLAVGTLPTAAIHGVGGTKGLLFALQPEPSATSDVGVFASLREGNHQSLGRFTPPPEGFRVPLSLKVLSSGPLGLSGVVVILDNRIKPAEIGTPGQQAPTLYKYSFSVGLSGLQTTLLDSFPLPVNASATMPNGVIFPGSIALLPAPHGIAVTDNFGGLWQVKGKFTSPTGQGDPTSATMVLLDRRFVGQFSGPVQGEGKVGPGAGTIQPYTLLTPFPPGPPGSPPPPPNLGIYPGMHSAGFHRPSQSLCFDVTVPGGIYCAPLSLLLNTSIPPFAKTGDNPSAPPDFSPGAFGGVRQVVSPPPADPDGWLADGFDTDGYGDDPNGYYLVAPSNKLFQVRLSDPSCASVGPCPKTEIAYGGSKTIVNWTNEIAILPALVPELQITNLVVSVGQEYNNPAVNSLLGGVERYFGPSYFGRIWTTYLPGETTASGGAVFPSIACRTRPRLECLGRVLRSSRHPRKVPGLDALVREPGWSQVGLDDELLKLLLRQFSEVDRRIDLSHLGLDAIDLLLRPFLLDVPYLSDDKDSFGIFYISQGHEHVTVRIHLIHAGRAFNDSAFHMKLSQDRSHQAGQFVVFVLEIKAPFHWNAPCRWFEGRRGTARAQPRPARHGTRTAAPRRAPHARSSAPSAREGSSDDTAQARFELEIVALRIVADEAELGIISADIRVFRRPLLRPCKNDPAHRTTDSPWRRNARVQDGNAECEYASERVFCVRPNPSRVPSTRTSDEIVERFRCRSVHIDDLVNLEVRQENIGHVQRDRSSKRKSKDWPFRRTNNTWA